MAVLKLEGTKAPNFAGTSYILQNAGRSLNRAFEGVSSLLGKYQEGAQEKVDNEIFSEIAGLNREGLQKYFESGKLKGRGMSGDMREFLGERMGVIADVNSTRAGTAETLSGTSRAEVVAGRKTTAAELALEKTAFDAGGAGLAVDAFREQQRLGNVIPGSPSAVQPGGGGIGGGPVEAAVSRAPAHLINNESGGSFQATNEAVGSGGIKGHDGRVQAGAARITDAKNAGILPKGMTREEFRNSEPLQIAFENWHFGDIDDNIEKNGYSQYIGTKINGVTVTHAGMVDVQHLGGATGLKKFLESGGKYNKADENGTTLTDYLQMGGTAAVAERVGPTGSASAVDPIARAAGGNVSATPAQDAFRARRASNPNQTQAQAIAAERQEIVNRQGGQDRLDLERAVALQENISTALVKGLQDEGTTNATALRNSVNADVQVLNNVEKLTMWKVVEETANAHADVLSPAVDKIRPTGVTEATQASMDLENTRLEALPQTYTDTLERSLRGGPTAARDGLIHNLSLETDPQNPTSASGWWIFSEDGSDKKIIDNMIADIAEEAGVTHAVAAAGMIKFFDRDPFGPNTARARFRKQVTIDWLLENMDENSMRAFAGEKLRIVARRDAFLKDAKDLDAMLVLKLKQENNNADTSVIDGKIEKLTNTMLRGHTSGDIPRVRTRQTAATPDRTSLADLTDRIALLHKMELGSQAHIGVGRALRFEVENSTTLSDNEKRLLLAEIKG